MKTLSLSMGAFLLASLLTPAMRAQDVDLPQPSRLRPSTLQSDQFVFFASDQGKAAAAEPNAPPPPPAASTEKKDEEKKDEEKKADEEPAKPEAWTMPQPACLKCHGWTINGWLEAGMTFNGSYPNDGYNSPVGFNDLNQQIQVNQLYLSVNKAVDTKGCGLDWGGSFDLMYGTDSRFTQAAGLETPGNPTAFPPFDVGDPNFAYAYSPYRLSIPQAYLSVGINNLTMQIGHAVTGLGNETIDPRGNFFYSHSYTFLYGIPFTYTGITFTYKFDDSWTAMGGMQTGANQFDYSPASNWPGINDNLAGPFSPIPGQYQHLGYLGGLTYTGPAKKLNVNFQISISDDQDNYFGFNGGNPSNLADCVVQFTLIAKYNLSEKLQYIAEETYGSMQDATDGTATWYGFNQYLLYTLNDHWAVGVRGEWFHDGSGVVVINPEAFSANSIANGFTGVGFAGNFYEITGGVNWKANANLTVRPEIRWDWSDATTNIGTAAAPVLVKPFNGGTTDQQFLFAVDAILTF